MSPFYVELRSRQITGGEHLHKTILCSSPVANVTHPIHQCQSALFLFGVPTRWVRAHAQFSVLSRYCGRCYCFILEKHLLWKGGGDECEEEYVSMSKWGQLTGEGRQGHNFLPAPPYKTTG